MNAAAVIPVRRARPEELDAEVGPEDKWPRPTNLFAPLAAPVVTASDVPPVLGRFGTLFAQAAGFDATSAIVSSVVATAAVIDDGIRLALPGSSGHFESARLWLALIAPPATAKSPSQKAALGPIYAIHSELVEASQREATQADSDGNASAKGEGPVRRALFTSDATIDKLADVLRANRRGVLYCVDELDSWLGGHEAFSRDGGSRNRGETMRLYDGGPHQVDRVGRGSFYVPNWGCSILTATTPAALARLSRKLGPDGLFARFMVFTAHRMQVADHTLMRADVEGARAAYEQRLQQIFAMSSDLVEKPIVRLSAGATALYLSERERLLQLCEAAESIGEGFAAHVAKHPGMLARIALTFHCASEDLTARGEMRHPCAVDVSEATMATAIRLLRKEYRHAYAIYSATFSHNGPLELALAMARSILADSMADFNRREMTHRCKAFRGATDWQKLAAFRALEDFAWIEGDTLLPEHGGRWRVNPNVHTMFVAEAERAQARRALVRDAITGASE